MPAPHMNLFFELTH